MNRIKKGAASEKKSSVPSCDGDGDGLDLKKAALSTEGVRGIARQLPPSAHEEKIEGVKETGDKESGASDTDNVKHTAGASHFIEKPEDGDVLFGRGRPYQSHPGNLNLHRLVALHKDMYEKSRRFDKLAIADQIVFEIKTGRGHAVPGRFLRRVEGEDYWEEAPHEVCREKVAHALRGHIKQARQASEKLEKATRDRGAEISSNTTATLLQTMNPHDIGLGQLLSSRTATGTFGPASAPNATDSLLVMLQQQHEQQRRNSSFGGDASIDRLAKMVVDEHEKQQLLRLLQQSSTTRLQAALQAEQQRKQQQERLILAQLLQQAGNSSPLAATVAEQQTHHPLLQPLLQAKADISLAALLEQQKKQQQQQQLQQQRLQEMLQRSNDRSPLASFLANASASNSTDAARGWTTLSGNAHQFQQPAEVPAPSVNEVLRLLAVGQQSLQADGPPGNNPPSPKGQKKTES